jgi:membrane-associated phospholipid phosphatase
VARSRFSGAIWNSPPLSSSGRASFSRGPLRRPREVRAAVPGCLSSRSRWVGEVTAIADYLHCERTTSNAAPRCGAARPHGDFTHTWFKYPGTFGNSGSFPSGHALAAFSVASVFANRYRWRRWVPWVAYGGATVIALSRIPVQAHFPSDVFVGATLGYVIGHYAVLRR